MIGIIGGGSWATAMAKILLENKERQIKWWVRSEASAKEIAQKGCNTRHLPQATLDATRITVSTDLMGIISGCTHLLLAIPSAFVYTTLKDIAPSAFEGKKIISAIKGSLPERCQSVAGFMQEYFNVREEDICVLSGPTHAEEVCGEKPTFFTLASCNKGLAEEVARMMQCSYTHIRVSDDIVGAELCGLGKNIYAIAAGICQGFGFGDNLTAVLTTAAMREMLSLLSIHVPHIGRDIFENYFMGDLMVTCWSRHSRNRALGEAVARGERPEDFFAGTGSVAEGYYSVKNLHKIALQYGLIERIPIAETIYRILYETAEPRMEMDKLIDTVL